MNTWLQVDRLVADITRSSTPEFGRFAAKLWLPIVMGLKSLLVDAPKFRIVQYSGVLSVAKFLLKTLHSRCITAATWTD